MSGALDRRTKLLYGLPEMPLQVATIPVVTFIPNYYGSELGVSLAAIGVVWMLARLFDGVSDPLIGYLSDRTASRWGRRRVWMVAALPIMMLALWKLFFPGGAVDAMYLLVWMLALWLGWTMLIIPYYAWGAELSDDYHERTSISAWRTGLGMVANVLSKLLPVAALYFFSYGGTREVLNMVGWMVLAMLPLTVLITVTTVSEAPRPRRAGVSLGRGLRLMMENGPFLRLMLAFLVNYTGTAMSTATVLFFIRGVVQEEDAGIVMILTYYLATLASIPFWLQVSRRIGKHRAWMAGLSLFVLASPFYMLLGPGDFYWMLPISFITGIGGGAFWVMPNAMKADVIDLDEANSGENRAALFFAMWSMAMKLALSIGPMLALTALAWTGFDATPGAVNGERELLGLRIIYVFATPVFYGIAILIIRGYPITEEYQRELRTRIGTS